MKQHDFKKALAVFLTIILIAPSAFFIAPQKAHAEWSDFMNFVPNLLSAVTSVMTIINTIKGVVQMVQTATSGSQTAAATKSQQINSSVTQAIAYNLSAKLLKSMTASSVAFVSGKTNGTGKPQFVTNLRGNLQSAGDVEALAFFAQLKKSNSPFASSITASLSNNYMQNTSTAGFFAANQCTLSKSSPNVNKFLAGDWSQGGVGAWLALTTQDQNNPYTLYQASQNELAAVVASEQSSQLAMLNWGQGYLSWCGKKTSNSSSVDPCTNKDGTPGTIQTPGSTIKASLDTALSTDQYKLTNTGSPGSEINSVLSNITSVMNTAGLGAGILGGSGLAGIGNTSASSRDSSFSQYQNSGFLGVNSSTIYKNAASLPSSGSDLLAQVSQYESAWKTIGTAAKTASTSVIALRDYCTAQSIAAQNLLSGASSGNEYDSATLTPFISASAAQAAAAQTALDTEIAPVFAQMASSTAIIAAARAMVQRVQDELNSSTINTGNTYAADLQTLQVMPPTSADVANAQVAAQSYAGFSEQVTTASPAGSLTVSSTGGSSLVDEMNLISTNANALKASCTIPTGSSGSSGTSQNCTWQYLPGAEAQTLVCN